MTPSIAASPRFPRKPWRRLKRPWLRSKSLVQGCWKQPPPWPSWPELQCRPGCQNGAPPAAKPVRETGLPALKPRQKSRPTPSADRRRCLEKSRVLKAQPDGKARWSYGQNSPKSPWPATHQQTAKLSAQAPQVQSCSLIFLRYCSNPTLSCCLLSSISTYTVNGKTKKSATIFGRVKWYPRRQRIEPRPTAGRHAPLLCAA